MRILEDTRACKRPPHSNFLTIRIDVAASHSVLYGPLDGVTTAWVTRSAKP
jgi:hypothetical protein